MEKEIDNRLQYQNKSSFKGENIIAIMSAQHGCGKTWFAISLAQVLGALKQKVLLFDASGGLNNIKNQLGLGDFPDLDKVVYGGESLNQITVTYNKGHFDVILGNYASSGLATMSIGGLQIFSDDLNIVSQNYDMTILDIDSTAADASKVLSYMSKSIIVICNDTISSITESYKLIRDLYAHCPHSVIGVVINQVNDYIDGKRAYASLSEACNHFLNEKPLLLGVIHDDTRVRDSIRSQSTIINRYPSSEASEDVMLIAREILGKWKA